MGLVTNDLQGGFTPVDALSLLPRAKNDRKHLLQVSPQSAVLVLLCRLETGYLQTLGYEWKNRRHRVAVANVDGHTRPFTVI